MKVLMVVDGTYLPKMDGVVVSILNTTDYLVKKGHEVFIFAPEAKDYKDKKQENITIHRFKSVPIPTYPEGRVSFPRAKKFINLVREIEPDIIHTHSPGPLGILATIAGKKFDIPLISTYHTSFPDFLMYVSPVKILKLDKLFAKKDPGKETELEKKFDKFIKKIHESKFEERRKRLSRKAVLAITNQFYNRNDLVIAPAKRTKKELIEYNIKAKVKVISNGLHITKFKKKTKYNKFPKFLHVGRLSFEKRIDIILDAMALVIKNYPEATLTIIGKGPAMESLEAQSLRLNLKNNVKFKGFVKRDRLPEIYREHDVFVTASEMETQGIVLLEALASGLPVIGVNMLATPDVVHNNKTGFLVKKGDSKKMGKRMIQLIQKPKLVREMGVNARKEAKKHDIRNVMKTLEKTYLKLARFNK